VQTIALLSLWVHRSNRYYFWSQWHLLECQIDIYFCDTLPMQMQTITCNMSSTFFETLFSYHVYGKVIHLWSWFCLCQTLLHVKHQLPFGVKIIGFSLFVGWVGWIGCKKGRTTTVERDASSPFLSQQLWPYSCMF
jgi:hypothetical protein